MRHYQYFALCGGRGIGPLLAIIRDSSWLYSPESLLEGSNDYMDAKDQTLLATCKANTLSSCFYTSSQDFANIL